MAKAKAAGSFLGGLFGNPVVALLLLGLGGLLIFRKDITNFLDKGIGNITLPDITLPDIKFPEFKFPEFKFPDFKFPDITFPEFKFPDIFGTGLEKPLKMVEDTGLLPAGTCECGSSIVQDAFGNVNQTCKECPAPVGMNPALSLEPSDAELFAKDFPEPFVSVPVETAPIISNLPTGFEAFQVGDSGFVGAAINPIPIQNLSLSQIIDKFDVSASQAANILAIAKDDFGNFDFGTNTGGGIGSIIPTINEFIGGSDTNVSSSEFEGLSPQEIANILTGGNIQNF